MTQKAQGFLLILSGFTLHSLTVTAECNCMCDWMNIEAISLPSGFKSVSGELLSADCESQLLAIFHLTSIYILQPALIHLPTRTSERDKSIQSSEVKKMCLRSKFSVPFVCGFVHLHWSVFIYWSIYFHWFVSVYQ